MLNYIAWTVWNLHKWGLWLFNLMTTGIFSTSLTLCGPRALADMSTYLKFLMSFPTKGNLCTRFATELVLRRDQTSAARASINPGAGRSPEEKARPLQFEVDIDIAEPIIGSVIEKAEQNMGLSDTEMFSTDTLRIELCGPAQPHLTRVDLPVLFRAGNRDQSLDDATIVGNMVRSYMERP